MKSINNKCKAGSKKPLKVEKYYLDISQDKNINYQDDLGDFFDKFHDNYNVIEVTDMTKNRHKEKCSLNKSSKNSSCGSTKNNTSRTIKTK